MTALLLAPHADDETLFAAFTCLHFQPLVVVCFDGGACQESEGAEAAEILGCEHEQWPYKESRVLPRDFRDLLHNRDERDRYDRVFAPALDPDGHTQHNEVGSAALAVFGDRVTGYLTYTRSGGRSRSGEPVETTPEWIARKLAALSCYRSQIERTATRPWFYELLDLREWYA